MQTQFELKSNQHLLILGKTQSGKTTLAQWLVKQADYHYVIVDVVGNWLWAKQQYNYVRLNPHTAQPYLKELFKRVWKKGNIYLILDETDRYRYTPEMSDLLNLGANRNIGIMMIARRTTALHKDMTANTTWTFIFNTKNETDYKHLKLIYGGININELMNLAPYHFLLMFDQNMVAKGTLNLQANRLELEYFR